MKGLNHFYQKSLFSLKLNTFNFVWELSLNSATFWYTSWFLYSHSEFYIDIQSLIQQTLIYNARKQFHLSFDSLGDSLSPARGHSS